MLKFLDLKKNCKKSTEGFIKYRFALLGDSATQFLSIAIKGMAWENAIELDMFEAGYNQIKTQVLNPNSELYAHSPQMVMIYMCSELLAERFYQTDIEERSIFAKKIVDEITEQWDIIHSHCNASIIQCSFREIDDGVFGNYAALTEHSFYFQIKKLNYLMYEEMQKRKNIFNLSIDGLYAKYGENMMFSTNMYYSAKMTLSEDILPIIAKQVLDIVKASIGQVRKCVVCDLDNTLWGGVIGDDGLEKIEVGEYKKGRVFADIQYWLKELRNRGILLVVCSKNEKETAMLPFTEHPDMILKLEDFAMFVANWENKADNVKDIIKQLNLGSDSFVFLDDNKFERENVKAFIPEVTVPELPESPEQYLSFLKELNLFETITYSEEDLHRSDQYRTEATRKEQQARYSNYDEYLENLEMKAAVKPFDKFFLPRIAQLTQRSNQFNLRTIRYTEKELVEIMNNPKYITQYYTLKDKYGDYGVVSVVILERKDQDNLFVHQWLMSCRVLKKGMEEFIVNKMVTVAKKNGYKYLSGEYIKTPKNQMVECLYDNMEFNNLGNGIYCLDTEKYVYKNIKICEEEG